MIVVNILSKGLIPCGQVILRHTRTKKEKLRPTILSLYLKNRTEDKKSYKIRKSLHVEDRFLVKHPIIKMQKQTKALPIPHKLHSLHPFI